MTDLLVPQSGRDAFGRRIVPLPMLLARPATKAFIYAGLCEIFGELGLEERVIQEIAATCIEKAQTATSLLAYEQECHAFLVFKGALPLLLKKAKNRADRHVDLIRPYLKTGKFLDLGCGPGQVGKICAEEGSEVVLADVYEHPSIRSLGLLFVKLLQRSKLPFADETFDNILMFAMLHHTEDPLLMIREASRTIKIGGRVHLVETVYGLRPEQLSLSASPLDRQFASLSEEEQRHATMFFDYFGNHVTWYYTEDPDQHVPVPFNFHTPTAWEALFVAHGFKLIEKRPLHLDPAASVFHHLFIFERESV
jgi:SAM-dependent methyltransferase